MRSVIENHAVNKTFYDRRTLVLLRGYKTIHRRRYIYIQRAGKECTPCAEHQLCRHKRSLYRTERTALAHKPFRARRRVLTFGQTIDAVIEQTHIQVHIPAYLVDKMVSADSETVTVAGHLPDGQFRMARLHTRSNGSTAAMNSIETVRIEIMRHTA